MSAVKLFENVDLSTEVRVVAVSDRPLLSAEDLAKALGYSQTQAMLKLLREKEIVKVSRRDLGLRPGKPITYVTREGFYRAAMRSTLPAAEAFQDWIVEEVLPAIENDGFYIKEDLSKSQSARLAERIAYTGVRDYIAGATDYVSTSATARNAFASVQNMYHKRVTGMTASQLVVARAESKKVAAKDLLDERELRLEEALTYAVRAALVSTFIDCEYTMKRVVDVASEAIENFKI